MNKKWCFLAILFLSSTDIHAESDGPVLGAFKSSLEQLDKIRKEIHRWDRTVRGFRNEHNFSLSLNNSSYSWSGFMSDPVDSFEDRSESLHGKFQYRFHLHLVDGLGYYLGSAFNVYGPPDYESDLVRDTMFIGLPGIVAGLAWNLSPAVRIAVGIDAFLLRIERFERYMSKDSSETREASANARVLAYQLAIDTFFTLKTAVRAEWEYSELFYSTTKTKLRRKGHSFGVGLVYHLI